MKKHATIVLLAFAVLVGGRVLDAITFGEPDGTRHPYVGTVIFEAPSGFFSCSGTLMSSTVFLTAGHCTSEGGVANLNSWVKFTPSISFAGYQNYQSLAAFLNDPANGWVTGDAVPHPLYNDFNEFPAIFDVGVILLDTPVVMTTYGRLPSLNFLETIRGAARNRFTAVGYGSQGIIRPFKSDIYARFQGQVRLLELSSFFDAGMTAKFSNNPGIGGGTCFGDSGGPIFYGTNTVVAVVSWGITPCIGTDYQFRVDTALAQNFLNLYVP